MHDPVEPVRGLAGPSGVLGEGDEVFAERRLEFASPVILHPGGPHLAALRRWQEVMGPQVSPLQHLVDGVTRQWALE